MPAHIPPILAKDEAARIREILLSMTIAWKPAPLDPIPRWELHVIGMKLGWDNNFDSPEATDGCQLWIILPEVDQ